MVESPGLTTAYLLDQGREEGRTFSKRKPGLVRRRPAHTTAHLAWVIDDRFARVASIRGDDVARAAADSHRDAISAIEQIVATETIDCDFRRVDGYLFPGADGPDVVNREADALRRLGIPFKPLDGPPLPGLDGPA